MVEWICQKCRNYNDQVKWPGKKLVCSACNHERTAPLPKQPAPTLEETKAMLQEELRRRAQEVPPPLPPLPAHHEEPAIRHDDTLPIDDRDPRCKIGAHVCRYCNTGFLTRPESEPDLPEELGGKKKR